MAALTISVALCTYNSTRFLAEQLASIVAQRRLPDELIICDDASQDHTLDMLRDFTARSPIPVKLSVNARNLGYVKNFEQAISLCSGELIALSDHDDVWYPHKLAAIEQVFSDAPETTAVFSDADVVDEQLNPLGYRIWTRLEFTKKLQQRFALGEAFDVLLRQPVITGSSLVFRSNYRRFLLPLPEIWVHDAWITLMIAATASIVGIAEPLLQYRQHRSNQIGMRRYTLAERLGRARERGNAYYQREYQRYKLAYETLSCREQISPEKLAHLQEAVKHIDVRRTLPPQRLRRLAPILRELRLAHYERYANGVLSAVRDLIL